MDSGVFSGGVAVIAADESQRIFDGVPSPLVIKCVKENCTIEEATSFVTNNQEHIEQLLSTHRAILFRDFPLFSSNEFSSFVKAFTGWVDLPYEDSLSYAVRLPVCDRVCTTNEGKTGGMIFHHEQAQAPRFPSKLFFYCEKPATTGGGTGISPSDILYQRLKAEYPDFIAKCESTGVLYTATLPPEGDTTKGVGRSWKSFFGCKTKEETEARLKHYGYTFHWEGDNLRMTTPVLPAVKEAPGTNGVKVFFNQMIAQYRANAHEFSKQSGADGVSVDLSAFLTYGDGTSVETEPLDFAYDTCNELAVDIQWQAKDVALLDNYLVQHARRAFDGPRRVLASLVQ